MMRCLTTDQKKLYQQYARLGEELEKKPDLENNLLNATIWETLSKEGIWRLPIVKQYGGQGLTWQDCIVALDGFFSQYSHTELLTRLISQISSLYLIAQYGTTTIKEDYLPRLVQGEMARLIISKDIHLLLPRNIYLYVKRNKISYLRNNKIRIYVRKIKGNIIFYINEKKLILPSANADQSNRSNTNPKSIGLTVLCDLINFEKLFYGILSASFASRVFSRIKMEKVVA